MLQLKSHFLANYFTPKQKDGHKMKVEQQSGGQIILSIFPQLEVGNFKVDHEGISHQCSKSSSY